MVPPFSKFYGNVWVGFGVNTGKRILLEVSETTERKGTERAWVLLKNGTRDFQNSPLFVRSACFYVTISGYFEHF